MRHLLHHRHMRWLRATCGGCLSAMVRPTTHGQCASNASGSACNQRDHKEAAKAAAKTGWCLQERQTVGSSQMVREFVTVSMLIRSVAGRAHHPSVQSDVSPGGL